MVSNTTSSGYPLNCYSVQLISENERNEYRKMVASVQSAWNLVRDKLKDHGILVVELFVTMLHATVALVSTIRLLYLCLNLYCH